MGLLDAPSSGGLHDPRGVFTTRWQAIVSSLSTDWVWTNQPAAFTIWGGAARIADRYGDTTGRTQVRIVGRVLVVGLAGSKGALRYSSDGGATLKFLDTDATDVAIGAHTPQFAVDALGVFATPWAALPPGAIGSTILFGMVGQGGDGVIDPTFAEIAYEFR